MGHVTVIAELGSSPAPSWDFDLWCRAAQWCGADAVKVQLFRADHFPPDEQAAKRRLEFPRERLREFVQCAHAYGLTAGASVFDAGAVALAAQWCDWLKLAAREENNAGLMLDACKTGKRVYRSVTYNDRVFPDCIQLYAIQSYPARTDKAIVKLLAWSWRMRSVPWGWSSHTTGYLDCLLAARLGASVVEKHLALATVNIEAGHSLQPGKFADMVRAIRKGER